MDAQDGHRGYESDELVNFHTGETVPPTRIEADLARKIRCLVNADSPAMVAVVQLNAAKQFFRIAAWVMHFSDHVEVVSVDGKERFSPSTPDWARWHYDHGEGVRSILVTPSESAVLKAVRRFNASLEGES